MTDGGSAELLDDSPEVPLGNPRPEPKQDHLVDADDIKLMIAIPAYGGTVPVEFLKAAMGTQEALSKCGIKLAFGHITGLCYITEVRDIIASQFLGSGFTHLLMIDSDVLWTPDDVLRLLGRDLPIVAGIYLGRSDNRTLIYRHTNPPSELQDGLLEVRGVGTGFIMIKRQVFLDMRCHAKTYVTSNQNDGLIHEFFPTDNNQNYWVSEDYVFCDRARALGYKTMVDTNVLVQHKGSKWYTPTAEDVLSNLQKAKEAYAAAQSCNENKVLALRRDK